jgi:hypothetical protein
LTPGDTTTIAIPPPARGLHPRASTSIERTHSPTETIASLLAFFCSAATQVFYQPGQPSTYQLASPSSDTLEMLSFADGWPASLSATTTDPALQIG